ncbi:MAG: site-specific DNA-methyltransferase [Gammaproteobacteria bacterium]
MANSNGDKKQKFIGLLHELFQLNQAELDFGLYRIMHAKSSQIKAFIENDLAQEIDSAFAGAAGESAQSLLDKARAAVVDAMGDEAIDAAGNLKPEFSKTPKGKEYLEAKANAEQGDMPLTGSAEIYDHLYRFFSRYYDKGDFLSKRYHVAENDNRAAPYAVPYDGREVYLHWANKDQYYIKSSEYLQHFHFDLKAAVKKAGQSDLDLGDDDEPLKVTFRLVEASEGAHNNVKESESRFFIIHAANPVEVQGNELIVNFEYRHDPEKTGQENTWRNTRLEQAEQCILAALDKMSGAKSFLIGLNAPAPTEKKKDRTLLGKYLSQYSDRNTMDYFIHKDLGGFLRRELDFYIKNEIMRLDDVEHADASQLENLLGRIKALRHIARQIIAFLAQLENFQKKIWLKKKFVTETNYCITLDRVPKSLYEEIASNTAQREEWIKLFAIDEIKEDTTTPAYSEPLTTDFLKANDKLVLDTQLFDEDFKNRLLASIENFDEQCDGVLIHSENFGALSLINTRIKSRVSNVYIDPPYNTGDDEFLYKDSYQSSSWLSMVNERISMGLDTLDESGVMFISVGDEEQEHLATQLRHSYTKNRFFASLIWEKKKKGSFLSGQIARMKDYILCISKNPSKFGGLVGEIASETETYPCVNASNPREIRRIAPGIKSKYREPDYVLSSGATISAGNMNLILKSDLVIKDSVLVKELIIEGNWRYSQESMEQFAKRHQLYLTQDLYLRRIVEEPRYKRMKDLLPRLGEHGESDFRAYDINNLSKYGWGTNEDANDELHQVLGEQYAASYPKPSKLLTLLLASSRHNNGIWLDYFSGSGVLAHAVMNINRQDGGNRKYILIEMADYFDSVLKVRVQRNIYSKKWENGKPLEINTGLSQFVKYLCLESYEDTLNNLMLPVDKNREKVIAGDTNADLRRDYYLNYFLNVETRASASLLNVQQFHDPTAYTLMVKKPGSDSQTPVQVDLIETFNWLIGLEVALLDKPYICQAEFEREPDPELPEDQNTRWRVKGKLKETGDGDYWLRTVEGYVRRRPDSDTDKDYVLIVWRKLTDDPEKDAAVLEAFLQKKKVNQADTEFDTIYINGPHALTLPGEAKTRVLSLEETFHARMWADVDAGLH